MRRARAHRHTQQHTRHYCRRDHPHMESVVPIRGASIGLTTKPLRCLRSGRVESWAFINVSIDARPFTRHGSLTGFNSPQTAQPMMSVHARKPMPSHLCCPGTLRHAFAGWTALTAGTNRPFIWRVIIGSNGSASNCPHWAAADAIRTFARIGRTLVRTLFRHVHSPLEQVRFSPQSAGNSTPNTHPYRIVRT